MSGPNIPAVRGMLHSVGFEHGRSTAEPPGDWYRAARAVFHRLNGKNQLTLAFRQDRTVCHTTRTPLDPPV